VSLVIIGCCESGGAVSGRGVPASRAPPAVAV